MLDFLTYYYLDYFLLNLFCLDYFAAFSFEFRLRVHLKLTLKSGYQKLLKNLC